MVIDIDEARRVLLCDLIDNRLRNLSAEIRHTDSAPMRQDLRNDREVLRALFAELAPRAEAAGA